METENRKTITVDTFNFKFVLSHQDDNLTLILTEVFGYKIPELVIFSSCLPPKHVITDDDYCHLRRFNYMKKHQSFTYDDQSCMNAFIDTTGRLIISSVFSPDVWRIESINGCVIIEHITPSFFIGYSDDGEILWDYHTEKIIHMYKNNKLFKTVC